MRRRRSSGFGADDEPDLALLDDRVGLGARARAEEQVGDVAQAHRGLVDEVVALAAAVQPARHRDLGVLLVFERHLRRGRRSRT